MSDVRKLDAIRRCARPDVAGRPVYVFLPGHVPRGFDLERLLMHAILVMHDEVVNGAPFSAVWVCHNTDEDAQRLPWTWVRYVYRLLPPAYHAGAKAIGLAHPSLGVRAVMLGLSYVLSTPFWDKLVFADRVEFLDEIAKLDVLDLPQASTAAGATPPACARDRRVCDPRDGPVVEPSRTWRVHWLSPSARRRCLTTTSTSTRTPRRPAPTRRHRTSRRATRATIPHGRLSPSQVAEQASSAANGTFSGLGVLGLDGGSNRAAGGWDEAPAEIARPARTCGSLGMGVGAVRAWPGLDLGEISARSRRDLVRSTRRSLRRSGARAAAVSGRSGGSTSATCAERPA